MQEGKMKSPFNSALEPFGQALLDYWLGNTSAALIHEFKTGKKTSLPVSLFFRSHQEFLPTDHALEYCRGRILVVGAGTGVHALELEKRGYEVTAIDICPQAIQIMKERGVKDVRHLDFLQFDGERFDTILMLGHNIGMCETLKGIKGLLQKCGRLLYPGGQVLANSIKESGPPALPGPERYPGELAFRLHHEGITGPWMRWLHVDIETLTSHASTCDWSVETLIETEEGGFLARLRPQGVKSMPPAAKG